jgi:hypothetical protein
MDDKGKIRVLEEVIAQMLKPIRKVPLNVIVKGLSQKEIIRFNPNDAKDAELLAALQRAIQICGRELTASPIERPRPNEVGNDVEAYVTRALKRAGLRTARPEASSGRTKSTGYPDLLVFDKHERPTYLECKIFDQDSDPSTMRSFYLSPSHDFKVSFNARHLLLAFGMRPSPIANSRNSRYTPISFKLVDLHDLLCDVKYEFNSDNRRLYADSLVLLSGNI